MLVMHRNKFGHEYYTLVGGGVEAGEDLESALHRELLEETGLRVANPRLVYVEDGSPDHGTQYVYLCQDQGGEIAMASDSEEALSNKAGGNLYQPMWLQLSRLPAITFMSPALRQRMVRDAAGGWPDEPEHFKHTEVSV